MQQLHVREEMFEGIFVEVISMSWCLCIVANDVLRLMRYEEIVLNDRAFAGALVTANEPRGNKFRIPLTFCK